MKISDVTESILSIDKNAALITILVSLCILTSLAFTGVVCACCCRKRKKRSETGGTRVGSRSPNRSDIRRSPAAPIARRTGDEMANRYMFEKGHRRHKPKPQSPRLRSPCPVRISRPKMSAEFRKRSPKSTDFAPSPPQPKVPLSVMPAALKPPPERPTVFYLDKAMKRDIRLKKSPSPTTGPAPRHAADVITGFRKASPPTPGAAPKRVKDGSTRSKTPPSAKLELTSAKVEIPSLFLKPRPVDQRRSSSKSPPSVETPITFPSFRTSSQNISPPRIPPFATKSLSIVSVESSESRDSDTPTHHQRSPRKWST